MGVSRQVVCTAHRSVITAGIHDDSDDLSDDDKMSFVEDALKRSAVRCFYRISLCDTIPPHQMYAFRSTLGCGWSLCDQESLSPYSYIYIRYNRHSLIPLVSQRVHVSKLYVNLLFQISPNLRNSIKAYFLIP